MVCHATGVLPNDTVPPPLTLFATSGPVSPSTARSAMRPLPTLFFVIDGASRHCCAPQRRRTAPTDSVCHHWPCFTLHGSFCHEAPSLLSHSLLMVRHATTVLPNDAVLPLPTLFATTGPVSPSMACSAMRPPSLLSCLLSMVHHATAVLPNDAVLPPPTLFATTGPVSPVYTCCMYH